MVYQIEEIDSVLVSFWEKDTDDEDQDIFSMRTTIYPSYHAGDTVWLQASMCNYTKEMPLTKYKIVEVHHCMEWFSDIHMIKLEVYVEAI